jgi:predicted DNA-binding transcriptional regulator AlpA
MTANELAALLSARPMLRPKDLALRLGIHLATLYRWQSDPTLNFPRPTYVNGPFWSPEQIEAWLKLRQTQRRKAAAAQRRS